MNDTPPCLPVGDQPAIVQFGTSRFLQAHVDLFASQAAGAGQRVPPILIVQTSDDAHRARRVAAFGRSAGYPVLVRGLDSDGRAVDETVTVTSVESGLSVRNDWQQLRTLFAARAGFVVSNVGDTGYALADDKHTDRDDEAPPRGFPAILLALLRHRRACGGAPVTMLPCELVRRNGDTLKRVILGLARARREDAGFIDWLDRECRWANTLVDRIVSEPIEPVGAVAEPYALWAIETQPGLSMPFDHAAIVMTADLARFERLKLHILNLGHSWLAQRWIEDGRPDGLTVREAIGDDACRLALERVYETEVVPGFAAHGLGEAAAAYVQQTLPRFANPFLDHRLSDIAGNHALKVEKRIGGFLQWVGEAGDAPPMPMLAAIARRAGAVA